MAQAIFGQLELGLGGGTDRWKPANGGEDDIDKFKLFNCGRLELGMLIF